MKSFNMALMVTLVFVPVATAQKNRSSDATAQRRVTWTALDTTLPPEHRGVAIAEEADRRDTGFGDHTATLTMVLRDANGRESTREMRVNTLEVEGDGDKSLLVFDHPRDVRGTALLTFSHKVGSDAQWLYLPAFKRARRLSSNNRASPFMGSEFAYEDIASQEVEKYTYRFVREDVFDGVPAFVVERFPVDRHSGYSRQVVWWDQSEFRVLKVDYYDQEGDLLKTLIMHEYVQYLGQYWRATRMEMVNHQTGKSTTLLWDQYEFRNGLDERDFDRNSLRRAR